MYMKNHILAALREEFDHWERVLVGLNETQISTESTPDALSIKDEIAHLWAWQQRSRARMEAGLHNRPVQLPQWLPGIEPDTHENTEQINAWIYAQNRELSWAEVHGKWRAGFLQLLELAAAIPEAALLDGSRYDWLKPYSLAFVLVSSYDHHHEHLEKLLARIGTQPR